MKPMLIAAVAVALLSPVAAEEASGTISGPITGEAQAPPIEIDGSDGLLIAAMVLDPDRNGVVDEREQDAVRGFAAREQTCDGLIVSTATPEQIIAVESAKALDLMLVCAKPDGLDPEKRAAIAANPTLLDRLATAGFGLGDVAGIVLSIDGRGTLYLSLS